MCMERGGTVATEEDWRNVNVYPEWVDVYHVNGRGVVKVVGWKLSLETILDQAGVAYSRQRERIQDGAASPKREDEEYVHPSPSGHDVYTKPRK